MRALFTVIHQISHIDEEVCLRMTLRRILSQPFPIAVVTGLGVGENKTFEASAVIGYQRAKTAAVRIVKNRILILGAGF